MMALLEPVTKIGLGPVFSKSQDVLLNKDLTRMIALQGFHLLFNKL